MDKIVDPAYFNPNEWTKVEGDNPLEECYVHKGIDKSISPEKFHQLYYDNQVIEESDVTPNDEILVAVQNLDPDDAPDKLKELVDKIDNL